MADAYQMFIDGEWVNSSDGQTRDVINPATGEVLATVQEGTKEDANKAVAAAKRAFEGDWYDSTPKDRQLALLKLADRIEEHADEIVKLEAQNVGKPCGRDALGGDPADRRQPPVLRRRRAGRWRAVAPGSTWRGSRATSAASRSAWRG